MFWSLNEINCFNTKFQIQIKDESLNQMSKSKKKLLIWFGNEMIQNLKFEWMNVKTSVET